MSKFLIAGLGNIGDEYANTRHNVGFLVAEALASALHKEKEGTYGLFRNDRLASVCDARLKGKSICIIKPNTYMNLSGKAVNYWLQFHNIPLQNLLVITDDLALPFGTLRMKNKGGDGGHNGLTDIIQTLNTQEFARLRFGIGNEFAKGRQVDYVLGEWTQEEKDKLKERIDKAVEMVNSFVSIGIGKTMSEYNNK
ncbi:MAG: aminoacyl-tRNA hydrolase [Bacteroidetes bacterium]|nr:MAG: aminoacyl-tRNA hydrolase [Bacteroidota bacterium]REK04721.1 MAG: aminoacyl-tRNA hydrolase [Bacteroidota bacterium]REK36195.1 MAG: aminoacyl-tRNA hydrolase [Bacteroidota bacterium]REK51434.1 MAG: aminoacyl-tRNA hydrolase [Bacteroidota bacterium]